VANEDNPALSPGLFQGPADALGAATDTT